MNRLRLIPTLAGSILGGCFLLLTGCEPPTIRELPPIPPVVDEEKTHADAELIEPKTQLASEDALSKKWIDDGALPMEEWFVHYYGGKRIGYYRTQVTKGAQLYRITREGIFQRLGKARPGEVQEYRIELEAYEEADGQFVSYTERTQFGESLRRKSGQLSGQDLRLDSEVDGKLERNTIPWQEGTWGVLGLQAMFMANPMKPGDRRVCKVFILQMQKIVEVELVAREREITPVPGGQPTLIPVEATMKDGEEYRISRNWIDENGSIQKTVTMGSPILSTFRAPAEIGRQIADEMQLLRLGTPTAKYVGGMPEETQNETAYIVESFEIDVYGLWDRKGRQSVKSTSALSALIRLADTALPENRREDPVEQDLPAYTQPSKWLPFDHPSVQELAIQLSKQIGEPANWTEDFVLQFSASAVQKIQAAPAQNKVATALETTRRSRGDHEDRCVLLAALLRCHGIPTRMAFGLRLVRETSEMAPFVWVEAQVLPDIWLPIDASTAKRIGPDCIKMFDAPLTTDNIYPHFLRVRKDLDKFTVRMQVEN